MPLHIDQSDLLDTTLDNLPIIRGCSAPNGCACIGLCKTIVGYILRETYNSQININPLDIPVFLEGFCNMENIERAIPANDTRFGINPPPINANGFKITGGSTSCCYTVFNERLATKDCLHNLRMDPIQFYAAKWKNRKLVSRQITFDTKGFIDAELVLDPNPASLELFLYFECIATEEKPKVIRIGVLDSYYTTAYKQITDIETAVLRFVENTSKAVIGSMTKKQIRKAVKKLTK